MIDTELAERLERMNGIWPSRPLREATITAWLKYLRPYRGTQLDAAIDQMATSLDRMPALKDVMRVMKEQAPPPSSDAVPNYGVLCWEVRPRRTMAQLAEPEHNPLSEEQKQVLEFKPDQIMAAQGEARNRGWDLYGIVADSR